MKIVGIFLVLLFISTISYADDSIDVELKECLESSSGQTTAGATDCTYKAASAWDSELNNIYREITLIINDDMKKSLVESQRAWIKHRDSEMELIEKIYRNKQGTMFVSMKASDKLEIVKSRVMELRRLKYKIRL